MRLADASLEVLQPFLAVAEPESEQDRIEARLRRGPMLTLGTIVEGITGRRLSGLGQVITDAAIDSRLAISGGLFVALPGERTDGHEHVAEAFARGAIAALVERDMGPEFDLLDLRVEPSSRRTLSLPSPELVEGSKGRAVEPSSASITTPVCLRVDNTLLALQAAAKHWRQQLSHREFHRQALRVIAITGSVGKSTTKELAAEILQRRFRTHRNPGNLNNEIGLPLSVLQISSAQERAVLEMGFYVPGEIALLCEIAHPQVGVITNVSEVHLERAGSLEAIVQGKGELVESLPPAPEGVAILNIDDENVRGMASRTRARVFYYGLSPDADLWASDVEGLGLEGVRFQLHHLGEIFHVRVPLLGQHSVHTALRAAAVGLAEGMSWDDIIAGLQQTHSQLRLVAVNGPGGSLLLDDTYNAAPPSVIAALNLLQELEGRHIAVLGDMLELGEFEERGHRMVGARAAEVVHELVTVGERARWIAEEALRAGMPQAALATLPDSQAAVEYLRSRIGAGDVVLIKGSRGVHMDEIVNELEVSD